MRIKTIAIRLTNAREVGYVGPRRSVVGGSPQSMSTTSTEVQDVVTVRVYSQTLHVGSHV